METFKTIQEDVPFKEDLKRRLSFLESEAAHHAYSFNSINNETNNKLSKLIKLLSLPEQTVKSFPYDTTINLIYSLNKNNLVACIIRGNLYKNDYLLNLQYEIIENNSELSKPNEKKIFLNEKEFDIFLKDHFNENTWKEVVSSELKAIEEEEKEEKINRATKRLNEAGIY